MEYLVKSPAKQRPYTEAEIAAVLDVMRSGKGQTQGEYMTRFQDEFRAFTGANHAFAVDNCTNALSLAATLCGVKEGDEVLCPAYTFCASAIPFAKAGAKIVWCDMDPVTWCVDPADIERAKEIIATVEPDESGKIDANGSEQYYLKMAQRLIQFIENRADHYDVPVQVIRIGNYVLYGFPSEIFSTFGRIIKEKTPFENYTIATLCNISYGYVPTRDMFYPTIYESKPGANLLTREAGYIMADKLTEMATTLKNR